MDVRVFDKSKLPSRHVSVGPARAPHRSYYYAMGMTARQIAQPFVGVASCWNEAAPCNISLMRQAQAVKKGVASAARVLHHHRHRRHRHGPPGHEVLARLARMHRRLGRIDHAWPLL
jgi:dihydroxyacid dehydratase/phosphogluconate dehydratase